jgi:hypothetical protein
MRRRELLGQLVAFSAATFGAITPALAGGKKRRAKKHARRPPPNVKPPPLIDDITGNQHRWPPKSVTSYSKEEVKAFLKPLPAKPTLMDFFKHRFLITQHLCRAGQWAMNQKLPEPVVLACLLHDIGQSFMRTDHGFYGAQILRPYVSEETAFAIQYHQSLRFYADEKNGYRGPPDFYKLLFGENYKVDPYIEHQYQQARKHKWYMSARLVTLADQETPEAKKLYQGDKKPEILDPEVFTDLIGRNFKMPKEGLGYDNTPVTHMWRSITFPDRLL